MAGSTYSSNLKIELMSTGENAGTWGNITNTNLGTALEQAIVGLGNPDFVADANLTITITNSNAAQAARALVLNVTSAFGSLTATRELVVPTLQKQYIVQNNTAGGQSITVKTVAGTGITVPNGRRAHLYVDGVNVVQMFDFVDINGGAIDGTPVGAAAASTGAFTSLTASGATTLNGAVALGDAAADLITVPGTVNSNLIFTDNSFDIGASGATRPRNLFLAGGATMAGNLAVGGTLTLTGGVNLNGNVTVGDAATDTLTINSTVTSNLNFTDNTFDIGASGATRPRNLFLAGNATVGGAQTLTGALTVDSTTDSTSITTGSIQTDGGLGVAKALFVGTTANIAGVATLGNGAILGTPASGVVTNLTGTASININGTVGATTASTGAFTNLAYTGTLTGGTGVVNLGSGQLFKDASGNVGIGTSSPGAKLDVSDATRAIAFIQDNDGRRLRLQGPTASLAATVGTSTNHDFVLEAGSSAGGGNFMGFNTAGSERLRIDSAGNVGIGTSSPGQKLDVVGSDVGDIAVISGVSRAVRFGANSTHGSIEGVDNTGFSSFQPLMIGGLDLRFTTSTTERMRIDSSGNLLIGTTATSPTNGAVCRRDFAQGTFWINATSVTTSWDQWTFVNGNGTVGTINTNGSATAYNTSSDYRLKNITGPITTSGAYIDSLNPVEGTWKVDGATFVGLIAHEVQQASRTNVATGVKDGEEMQGMDYSNAELIANLIAEVKSLRQRLAALESN